MTEAERLKDQANALYKSQLFSEAIANYSQAIELQPDNPILYCNRSIAYLKMECFGSALEDASRAIELDGSFIKGYYRRAAAFMALGKVKSALKDLEVVNKARPKDADASMKYRECEKLVRKMAFERAISVEERENSAIDAIDIDGIEIEDGYRGPAIEKGKVTREFIVELLETFKNQGKLHKKYAYIILRDIKACFESQPSLIDVYFEEDDKFTVCGDIHGQFYDLLNIFKLNGLPSDDNPYLFNGDFVDRGSFSVECIFTLFSFKLLYPSKFFMSRGNHESLTMNKMYGFDGEVTSKYSADMAKIFVQVFNLIPLAHCLNRRVLVMHGGLFSTNVVTLEDLKNIDRNRQPPESGVMCELLWSDPQPSPGWSPSKRGLGVQFGPDITEAFTTVNALDYIIRSHEMKEEGYEVAHNGKCITVFSAPNYCDTMGNKGAYITMNGRDMKPNFHTFEAVEHPPVQPMAYANPMLFDFFR